VVLSGTSEVRVRLDTGMILYSSRVSIDLCRAGSTLAAGYFSSSLFLNANPV